MASSPGLAALATLGSRRKNDSTAKRLRHFLNESNRHNRVAVGINENSLPRVAEAANPGLEAATALRFVTKRKGTPGANSTQTHQFFTYERV